MKADAGLAWPEPLAWPALAPETIYFTLALVRQDTQNFSRVLFHALTKIRYSQLQNSRGLNSQAVGELGRGLLNEKGKYLAF